MPEKSAASTLPMPRKSRPQWDKGEKRFLIVSLLLIALFSSSLMWWGRLNEVREYQIPTPVLPSPNAYDTHVRATFLLAPAGKTPVDPILDGEKVEDLKEQARRYSLARKEAWLGQNTGAFQLLRQGLRQEYQQPPIRSWSTLLPFLSRFRELARALIVESKAHALRGNYGAAASSALDVVHFGHQVPRGGPIITAYVGHAIQSIGTRHLSHLLPQLNAEECKRAARRLEKIRTQHVPYITALREEKWMGRSSLLEVMKKPDWANQFSMVLGAAPDFWQAWRFRLTGKRRILDNYTHYMDKSIAEAQKPYGKMQDVPLPDDAANQMLVPAFEHGRFNFARSETGSALVLVALALRAYRLETGAYPNNLATLIPQYLKAIPADGFGSGEALRYQKHGAGYKLWSIGPDRQDNKGAALQQQPSGNTYYDDNDLFAPRDATVQGDWVMQP